MISVTFNELDLEAAAVSMGEPTDPGNVDLPDWVETEIDWSDINDNLPDWIETEFEWPDMPDMPDWVVTEFEFSPFSRRNEHQVAERGLESNNTRCIYDIVSLYDGSSVNSPSLGRFCIAATSIRSTGSSLLVVFQTDSSISKRGFSLSWTFIGQGLFT